eukprot:1158856-Pelagomonas_calceolata.AAC.8
MQNPGNVSLFHGGIIISSHHHLVIRLFVQFLQLVAMLLTMSHAGPHVRQNPVLSDLSAMKELITSQWVNMLLVRVAIRRNVLDAKHGAVRDGGGD